jgi:hypothetical protein
MHSAWLAGSKPTPFSPLSKESIMKKIAAVLIASMFTVGAFAQAASAPMSTMAPAAGASAPAKAKHTAKHKAAKTSKMAASKAM